MGGLVNLFFRIFAVSFLVSSILFFARFVGPEILVCSEKGHGAGTKTKCLGIVEFSGDDLLSIYRVKMIERKIGQ